MKTVKALLLIICFQCLTVVSFAQEKFDIVTFTAPKGWRKDIEKDAIRFTKQDASGENYCVIMLFKSFVGTSDESRLNFNSVWKIMVENQFSKSGEPEMQQPTSENGWSIESGAAQIENNNSKGVALLISATGNKRVANLLIISNSQAYQAEINAFVSSLSLPKLNGKTSTQNVQNVADSQNSPPSSQTSSLNRKSGFRFTTTNFDDGWVAVEENDWVRLTKGALTVLLHYPHPKEKETFWELEKEARTFWDILVAPRYSNLTNFEVLRSDRDFEPARYAAGNVVDNQSGKRVFVALFSKLKRGWVEIIAPDKAAFATEFGAINVNDEIINWKPLLSLFDRNKFAVDASDLQGKWASTFAGTTQYANIYTGRYIGASTTVSAESYNFGAGNSYNWRIDAANSAGGRTDFAKAASTGKFTLVSNWELRFSDIEGRPQTYPVHFSCIRGARVLWVKGTAFGRIQ